MLQAFLKPQNLRLSIIVAVMSLLGFGYFLQYVEGLEPCPLCITQRFFLFCGALMAAIAWLHKPSKTGTAIYTSLGVLLAAAGGFFSSRQLYLQSLPPDQAPACGPNINFILETFPIGEALGILLRGDGNCAEVSWTFLSLSIPAWTLIAFIGLGIGWVLQSISYQWLKNGQ